MLVERFPLTELMSCNWRCLVHQTSILSFCKLQDIYTVNLTCVFMWQRDFHICCKDFQISVNLHCFLKSTAEFSANKWITTERSSTSAQSDCSLLKLNNFHCSVPLAGPTTLKNKLMLCSSCIWSFHSFGFKCNSWRADKELDGCSIMGSGAGWKKGLSRNEVTESEKWLKDEF